MIKLNSKETKIAIAVIVVSAALLAVLPFYSIRMSDPRTDCLPFKLWFIDKTDKDLKEGDYIAFRTPAGAVGVPEYKMWVKEVFAVGRGTVTVTPATPGETTSIKVNGIERTFPVRAYVSVVSGDRRETFRAFAADSEGRPLPITESQEIGQGRYYTCAPSERSYDSRYWGLLKHEEVLGTAYPLF